MPLMRLTTHLGKAKTNPSNYYLFLYPNLFRNPMHNRKIAFLYFKRIQKVLTKTIPHIRMFPNQIHIMKMKIKIVEVS